MIGSAEPRACSVPCLSSVEPDAIRSAPMDWNAVESSLACCPAASMTVWACFSASMFDRTAAMKFSIDATGRLPGGVGAVPFARNTYRTQPIDTLTSGVVGAAE